MTRLAWLPVLIVVTWDAVTKVPCNVTKPVNDPYHGEYSYVQKECDKTKNMKRVFASHEEARKFLRSFPKCLPRWTAAVRPVHSKFDGMCVDVTFRGIKRSLENVVVTIDGKTVYPEKEFVLVNF